MIAVVDGLEVGYDDVGAGMPVLFAHAFPLNRTMWAPNVSALVDRCRCVAADYRGFGESTVAPPFTMEQYADDLARLLDVLRIDRVVFTGCSMGGYVAFAFLRRHRDRVRALVLADTRAGADTDEGREKRRKLIEAARTSGPTAVANAQIASLVGPSTREKQPDTYDAVHRMIAQAPAAGIIGALEAMMARPDSTAMLSAIDVPTLVVVGAEDTLTPVAESERLRAAIPGSTLEIIAGAGHLASLERPGAFNHVLTEFLVSLTAS